MNLTPHCTEKICLIAIVKNEERFLNEWLIYHRMLGVDKFFIYDDDRAAPLKGLSDSYAQFVKVVRWWGISSNRFKAGNQLAAYRHALQNYAAAFDWVIFLDVDEFVVLRQHDTLQEFLRSCSQASAVSLNWHLFGHNGFIEDPGGLVTSHLTKRQSAASVEVKTISRVKNIADISSPHFCELKSGLRVDANNRPFSDDVYAGKTAIAHINHYQCRSYENWMGRVLRGDVNFDNFQDPREHHWRLDTQRCFEQFIAKVALCYNECEDLFMLRFRQGVLDGIRDAEPSSDPVWNCKLAEKLHGQLNGIMDCLKQNLETVKTSDDLQLKTLLALLMLSRNRFSEDSNNVDTAEQLLLDVSERLTGGLLNEQPHALTLFGITMELIAQQQLADVDTNILLDDLDNLLLDISYFGDAPDLTSGNLLCGHFTYFLMRLRNHLNVPATFGTSRYHERVSAIRAGAKILLDKIAVQKVDQHGTLLKALVTIDAGKLPGLKENIAAHLDRFRSELNGHLSGMSQQQWLMMTLLSILDKDNGFSHVEISPDMDVLTVAGPEVAEDVASTAITWSILLKMAVRNTQYLDLAEDIIEKSIGPITERLAILSSQGYVADHKALREIAGWGTVLLGACTGSVECLWLSTNTVRR